MYSYLDHWQRDLDTRRADNAQELELAELNLRRLEYQIATLNKDMRAMLVTIGIISVGLLVSAALMFCFALAY